jgi:hypothetical protein
LPARGGRFTGGPADHRTSEGVPREGSGTGGSRTHTHRGLSSAAVPVSAPCLDPQRRRAPGGNRTHASAIPRRQAPVTTRGRRHTDRAPSGSRTHTSALARRQAAVTSWARHEHQQSVRRGSHPRCRRGRAACCCYTTDASHSGSGGARTHMIPFKRRVPCRRRPHFLQRSRGDSNPRFPLGQRGGHSAGPRDRVLALRPGTPCGGRTRLCGLKDRRPHRRSNGALRTPPRRKRAGRGSG